MPGIKIWHKISAPFLSAILLLSFAASSCNSRIRADVPARATSNVPAPAVTVTIRAKPYQLLDLSYSITGVQGNYLELRWKMTLRNNTPYALRMGAIIIYRNKLFGELGRSDEIKPIWLDPLSERTVAGVSYILAEEYLMDNTDSIIWMY